MKKKFIKISLINILIVLSLAVTFGRVILSTRSTSNLPLMNLSVYNENIPTAMVNKNISVSSEFIPENLVKVDIPFSPSATEEEKYMTEESASSLVDMIKAAKTDGIELYGLSGYRSFQTQKEIFNTRVKDYGREYANQYVAKPGKSEHQLGLAMDIATSTGYLYEGTAEAIWLENNAHNYGFIIRYMSGKEHITGYKYEPWHVRYVGNTLSEHCYKENVTLEEILN